MGDKNKIGKPPNTISANRNNTSISSINKNSTKDTSKQMPSYNTLRNTNTKQISNKSVPKVTSNKNDTILSPSPSTSTTINDFQITAETNQYDNSSTSYEQNDIVIIDNTQPNSTNNLKQPSSFATITANEKTPSREQAIVFNSIDGVRQLEYILAIGKLIPPRDIIYTSRISNNRFCIFLSSKEVIEKLLDKSKIISINDHIIPIRRLINPAKKITISNVCPSIPNQVILDALKNINIIPVSQLNHIKAGINIEGYEHILSFRRQLFINQEDITKLPGSLLINYNQTSYRIFFTDDRITCFLCKAVGHTSTSCKKQNLPDNFTNTHILKNSQNTHNLTNTNEDNAVELLEDIQSPELTPVDITPPQNIIDWNMENNEEIPPQPKAHNITSQEKTVTPTNTQFKRPLSDTNTSKSPISPTASDSKIPLSQPDKKKAKTRSRSSSFTSTEDNKIESMLKPTVTFFAHSENTSVTLEQFKYFIENFRNPNINIHTLCDEINSNIPDMLDLMEKIRPLIIDRAMKTKLTTISNLLFKTLPPQLTQQNQ